MISLLMATVVIFYLFRNSGHHAAARAIDAALHALDPSVRTVLMDPLEFTHPRLSKAVWRNLLFLMRQTPDLWDALYDSRNVNAVYRRVQGMIHPSTSALTRVLAALQPDAIVATQAYALSMLCELRRHSNLSPPFFGVVTDFRVHRFWMHGNDVTYVVPTGEAATRLAGLGIRPDRIRTFGIPVGQGFSRSRGAATPDSKFRVLVMGGSCGLGPRYRTIRSLDRSEARFTIEAVTGGNRMLRNLLAADRREFRHPVRLRGFARNVPDLMYRADLLITKAGGLTCAEALCAGLPMLIIHPLPGQESGNTEELVNRGAAVLVPRDRDVASVMNTLFQNPELLSMMRQRARDMARPAAAFEIADEVLRSAALHATTRDRHPDAPPLVPVHS